jgi:hypothetical protein
MRYPTMMRRRWLALLVLAVAACSAPAASSLAPATFQEFATHACDAFSAMFRAVGNPDAGTDSELTKALDEAIRRGDAAEADRLAQAIMTELESGRRAASLAAAWPPGFAAMSQLDRVLLAFEAMIDAKRNAAGNPAALDPQAAFEEAGGLTAWQAMFEAARAMQTSRPANLPPHECEGVPISF